MTQPRESRRQQGRDEAFRLLAESVLDYAILLLDPAGVITSWGEGARRINGYEADEVLGRHCALFYLPDDVERGLPAELLARAGADGHVESEGWRLRKGGERFWAREVMTALRDPDGRLVGFAKVTGDLSERKRLEEEQSRLLRRAREREALLSNLLESAPDAILASGPDGTIVLANAQVEALFGYRRQDLLGQPIERLLPDELRPRHAEHRAAYLRSPRTRPMGIGLELFGRRKDGTAIPVEISLSPVRTDDGLLVLAVIRDISERRALERMEREFVGLVSHELMNPITALALQAELMQMTGAYSEKAVGAILGQAKQLERLVGDLLDVSRLAAGRLRLRPVETDLVALARTAAEEAQLLSPGHHVRLHAPRWPLVGRWDPGRLQQVLGNLLSNAIKYSPPEREIVVQVEDLGAEACVAVLDHGAGIAPDALPHLFERFYRAQGAHESAIKGLGLGLYIARSLVEAHGGTISAESQPGAGSTFRFTLPYRPPGES